MCNIVKTYFWLINQVWKKIDSLIKYSGLKHAAREGYLCGPLTQIKKMQICDNIFELFFLISRSVTVQVKPFFI